MLGLLALWSLKIKLPVTFHRSKRKVKETPPTPIPHHPSYPFATQVRVSLWYEKTLGRLAQGHFCVTKAMQRHLADEWGIRASVLHDRPPAAFRVATAEEVLLLLLIFAYVRRPLGARQISCASLVTTFLIPGSLAFPGFLRGNIFTSQTHGLLLRMKDTIETPMHLDDCCCEDPNEVPKEFYPRCDAYALDTVHEPVCGSCWAS
jgi:hypothetical protein